MRNTRLQMGNQVLLAYGLLIDSTWVLSCENLMADCMELDRTAILKERLLEWLMVSYSLHNCMYEPWALFAICLHSIRGCLGKLAEFSIATTIEKASAKTLNCCLDSLAFLLYVKEQPSEHIFSNGTSQQAFQGIPDVTSQIPYIFWC